MKLALSLGGTDLGRSGIGVYVRAVLPRLRAQLGASGGALVVLGTGGELAAYADVLGDAARAEVSPRFASPAAGAVFHLFAAGAAAARAGAEALLLPAANRRLTARSPIPTIAVVHDVAPLHVPGKYDRLRTAYARHVVVRALAEATAVVAVSEATRRDVARALGRPEEAVRLVPNGVDPDRFTPPVADDARVRAARAHVGLTGPYLLYASRLEHPGKNHLRLLRAFAESRARGTHVLALAGSDWGALPAIRAEIDRLGLGARVALLGHVPDALFPGLVAGADAVIMVGLREGFGLPVLEALAAGRPVLVARAGALPEVAAGRAALCDPLDEASIAAALDRALEDADLRDRAAREGPAYARSRSWDVTAAGLLAACHGARGTAWAARRA
jgi:glycosyltransferase involved in cell wall biosynthesis